MFLQHACFPQRTGEVDPGLPADRRQQRIRFLALDDLFEHVGGQRLDVGAVGKFGIGHDRGRVRIHQHDPVPFFLERFAGLRTGVIELARLADDDGPRTDDEDRLNVGSLGHAAQIIAVLSSES